MGRAPLFRRTVFIAAVLSVITGMATLSGSAAAVNPAVVSAVAGPPIGAPATPALDPGPAASPAFNQAGRLEDHFVTITPCRVVDTRAGGGLLANQTPRKFYVAGTFGFAPQGGHSGGCGVPIGASAVAVNVSAVTATNTGYLRGAATGSALDATFLNYTKNVNITANPTLSLANSSTPQLTVEAFGGKTQLLVDVTGYYVHQIEALISTTGGAGAVYSGSPSVLSVTGSSPGIAVVTLDRDVTNCSPTATAYYGTGDYADAKAFNTNEVTVYSWTLDPTTHRETYTNNFIYLTVTC